MRVVELWRFPVKSIGGERVEACEIGEFGITGDRGWGVRDDRTGNVLTGRREPRLLMATARLVDGVAITTTHDGRVLETDADFTEWLGRPVSLVRAGDEGGCYENPMDAENETDWVSWQGPGGAWHDSGRSRVSLVSTGSLDGWDVRRFRANVILDGEGEDELIGSTVGIGSARLDIVKAIDRCVMVSRPQPGLGPDLDVLRTINAERDGHLCVGALVDTAGAVAEGDELVPMT